MLAMRSYIFFGLSAVRILSIVAIILVFSSSIFVLVKDVQAVNAFQQGRQSGNSTIDLDCEYIEGSTVPNQAAGVFWAILNRLLIIFQVVMLFLSEVGWPNAFFERFFPVLGPEFGLGALGIFQALIGATVLSHHVDDFTLVSAFFLFSVGCLNMLLGLIFRESAKPKRSIAAYREGTKRVLPISSPRPLQGATFVPRPFHARADSVGDTESVSSDSASTLNEKVGYGLGFGRQGEKAAAQQGYGIQKPVESVPRYAMPQPRPMKPVEAVPRYAMPQPRPMRSPVATAFSSRFSEPSRYSHASADYDEEIPPVPPVPKFHSSTTAI